MKSCPSYVCSVLQQLWLMPTMEVFSRSGSRPAADATPAGKMIGPSQSETIGMSVYGVTACATMLTGLV